MNNTILEGMRVLDIANENGVFCTRVLAEMGAEVIKVEPPGGDPVRRLGPFAGEDEDPEKSLFNAFYNGGKKSVTLDIRNTEGKKIFKELIKSVDVLVETSKPGVMEESALGYEELKKENPALVMCSITPFGQKGPYSKWNASSDIIIGGLSGPMFETGVPGREPLQIGLNFIANLTGVIASSGIIAMYTKSKNSGEGGYLDVSMFNAAATWRGEALGVWQYNGKVMSRTGSQGMFVPMNIYPTRDGFVQLLGSSKWDQMIAWMKELDIDVGHFDDPKYGGPSYFNDYLVAERADVDELVAKLTIKYDKKRFMEEAQERGIPVGALETSESVLSSPHYRDRKMFKEVEYEPIGKYETLSCPIKFSEGEESFAGRPSFIGEHNDEVYGRIGISKNQIDALHAQNII